MCYRVACYLYVGAIVGESYVTTRSRGGECDVSDLERPVGEEFQFVMKDGECRESGIVVLCFLCAFTCYQNRIYTIGQNR